MYAQYSRTSNSIPYFSGIQSTEPPPDLKPVTRRLLIDSRDGSYTKSGNPFDFEVQLSSLGVEPLEHVLSVECKILAVPKVANETYCIVDIEQLRDERFSATNDAANRGFVVSFFDSSPGTGTGAGLQPGDYKPNRDFYGQKVTFTPLLNKVDKLNVRILTQSDAVVVPLQTANVTTVSMLLEFVTVGRR
jgi:hypothetical protein